jgi:hypothetical protein
MGRLHHLKKTLPYNLANNQYKNLEFVILDYNSSDGLEEWMRLNMMNHIESGRVSYYRTSEPKFWRIGHAKNLSSIVATGDIICNIDADNYIKDFAEYVNENMNKPTDILCARAIIIERKGDKIESFSVDRSPGPRFDACGRICVRKETFVEVGGYDEHFATYCNDDIFFKVKCVLAGCNIKLINDDYLRHIIAHTNDDRQVNCENKYSIIRDSTILANSYYIKLLNDNIMQQNGGRALLIKNFAEEINL